MTAITKAGSVPDCKPLIFNDFIILTNMHTASFAGPANGNRPAFMPIAAATRRPSATGGKPRYDWLFLILARRHDATRRHGLSQNCSPTLQKTNNHLFFNDFHCMAQQLQQWAERGNTDISRI
ncbi:hypothetical protein [Silvimonas amylolytica]|uniref:hypothetical protein n=1 Tax=Silvimonas amylolytica TaxID=449663 RepID=UPI0016632F20|nr:hypothetical protein [Silvimonas amylolytica]